MTKCGTVGERATEGTETFSTAPASDSGEMLPWVTHRQQTAKRHKQVSDLAENFSRDA